MRGGSPFLGRPPPYCVLRPESELALERLVRNELSLQRLLASSRRAASTRMSMMRRARVAAPPEGGLTAWMSAVWGTGVTVDLLDPASRA